MGPLKAFIPYPGGPTIVSPDLTNAPAVDAETAERWEMIYGPREWGHWPTENPQRIEGERDDSDGGLTA